MISVDEALSKVLALTTVTRSEEIALKDGRGRVLAEPAHALLTQPPFDAASMDGYAIRAEDAGGALRVIGEAAAGRPWDGAAEPGSAVRIFTGAPVPEGFDTVVMQENTAREGDTLRLTEPPRARHIRAKGSDFTQGARFDPARPLTGRDLGLLAAMNIARLRVRARPRVAVLPGGDELVPPGAEPGPGQIICSNDVAVAAIAASAGADAVCLPIATDTEEDLRARLTEAAAFDLIVTIGGASVGDHDLIGRVTEGFGMERSFYKIAMRPGKPLIAGRIGQAAMIGLPGNPVSSIVCAEIFIRPLLRAMLGLPPEDRLREGVLGRDLPAEGPRTHYLRARLSGGAPATVTPFEDQDSARLALMSQADALLVRPAGEAALKAGARMVYLPLD
ncbi:MAG: molybdopterin molybdotransferase MoeA [Paracoccus sp. (in: a-proteobacteria)]|nr:molybdopterin molybdotransferase MoeA [Paracoccus sp. (in: a-proteobacteria)]